MRTARFATVAALAIMTASCAAGTASQPSTTSPEATTCPETVVDGDVVDGIDLARPEWLDSSFPLPADLSIRHVSSGAVKNLTGFIAGAEPEIIRDVEASLVDLRREIIMRTEGFVPVANVALVATADGADQVAVMDVAAVTLVSRLDGGDCAEVEGVLLSLTLEPRASRTYWIDAEVTQGSAIAEIGDQTFRADGECLVRSPDHTFGTTSGATSIGVAFGGDGELMGTASVDRDDEAMFALDVTPISGTDPVFRASARGFSAEGVFIDGFGDLGQVPGKIEVACR